MKQALAVHRLGRYAIAVDPISGKPKETLEGDAVIVRDPSGWVPGTTVTSRSGLQYIVRTDGALLRAYPKRDFREHRAFKRAEARARKEAARG